MILGLAGITQWLECELYTLEVGGSIPPLRISFKRIFCFGVSVMLAALCQQCNLTPSTQPLETPHCQNAPGSPECSRQDKVCSEHTIVVKTWRLMFVIHSSASLFETSPYDIPSRLYFTCGKSDS